MQKVLNSLPDAKKFHPVLTLGKSYEIIREFGNGYVIKTDDGNDRLIILQERFT